MRSLAALLSLVCVFVVSGCEKKDTNTSNPTPPPATELVKKDLTVGKGAAAVKGDRVSVRYKGWLDNGSVFDESKAPDPPFTFALGAGEVIPGWDEGVVGMQPGGKRNLRIPWKMAYGEQGSPPKIPAKADLNFDIELISVTKPEDAHSVKAEIIKEGSGRSIKAGDQLTIHYEIKGGDGKVIDSSKDKGGPVSFEFGANQLMSPALEPAMQGMKAGEVRKITVPPGMGMPSMTPGMRNEGSQTFTITLVKIG
jgi:peptidylprolyl isomerase